MVHDFGKKISQGARFFTMVHACTKKFQQGIQPFKLPLCGLLVFIDMSTTCIYLRKEAGVSKYYLKKIMLLLWTVVTYLLKNVKHGIEHDIDSAYGDIRLS